jgi:ABC-type multidrug transport system ATPase subunit
MTEDVPVLSFEDVVRRCYDGSRELLLLDRVSFDLPPGACAGLYGARRSGKSTLLRLAAGLERPDAGIIRVAGQDITAMSALELTRLARRRIGFVSPEIWYPRANETVVEHLTVALGCGGCTPREARRRAYHALDEVGLAGEGLEATGDLPLAERMCLMLAAALMREPVLLLIDEPAAIPSVNGRERFVGLLQEVAGARALAMVVASEELAALQGSTLAMSIGSGDVTTTDRRGVVVPFPGAPRETGERSAL